MLEDLGVEFRDLLDLTLRNWQHFTPAPDSDETLVAILEGYLRQQYVITKLRDYEDQQQVIRTLTRILQDVYESLTQQLAPVLATYGLNIEIRLTKTISRDAIVQVQPEETDHV